jgi:nicotinamide-nucleotide amidase
MSREPDATEALSLLVAAGATLATAESLTGGRLAAAVTAVPGASTSYLGGFVTYATALKQSLLEVPDEVVERYGVVSAECASAMATGCRAATGATYAVSTTGVAGPDSQEGRPVGTVFVGLAGPDGVSALSMELVGDRHQVQGRACREALSALCETLRALPGEGRLSNSPGEQPPLG